MGDLYICDCCERKVERIHWMDWDSDMNWLCDDCMEQALEDDAPPLGVDA